MEYKDYYTIGDVSNICGISKKALRYYDQIGLISPDKVGGDNSYRFYNRETLLNVPIIKYYKQMGFKLDEMRLLLETDTFRSLEEQFRNKIEELHQAQRDIYLRYTSVKDWYDLILEAGSVIENNANEVSVKYIDSYTALYFEQDFAYNYMESIINIEFTNYIESINNAITGPVMINFPSFEKHMEGTCKHVRIMQKAILDCAPETPIVRLGGCMVLSCYHIGSHYKINETYEKMCQWAEDHHYLCGEESVERYVTDYWTSRSEDNFVTEIMIKVTKK